MDKLVAHYPLHPTLIDFLNKKLATVETFHGTRGVLRVLAVTVRNIWKDELAVPMVQTCHLNLRDARIVGEVLGRTGSSDLLPVLNADIGGVDTEQLEGGRSNAELADLHNPHPQGYPMHEWGWRVVFLHSLVGHNEGLQSELFGLTEQQALFEVSFPGLTPPQVQTALAEIKDSAFYLRMNRRPLLRQPRPFCKRGSRPLAPHAGQLRSGHQFARCDSAQGRQGRYQEFSRCP